MSGLFKMSKLKDTRLKWKGIDYTSEDVDYSSDMSKIYLEPQRIRSFVFKFKNIGKLAETLESL